MVLKCENGITARVASLERSVVAVRLRGAGKVRPAAVPAVSVSESAAVLLCGASAVAGGVVWWGRGLGPGREVRASCAGADARQTRLAGASGGGRGGCG